MFGRMASQENDRPQNTNAVKDKSKGKKKVSETTGYTTSPLAGTQSRNVGEIGTLDASWRLIIAPVEIGFSPFSQSLTAIMDSIKSFYRDAWSSWGEIPVFDREQMWSHFKIAAAFMLNNFLWSAWEKNQKPDWILEGLWARLNEKWTTEKFQKMSIQHVVKNKKDGHSTLFEPHVERKNTGYKKGLDEWHQSQPTSENDSSNQSPDDDEASILSKKIGEVKKGKARGLGSEHCVGCIMYGLSAASLSSQLKQNEEEIDSLRIQVHELLKKQKADRLRLAGLENLVHHLIDNFRSDDDDSDGEN
ncbi:hypothetical protein KY285_017474 [Solanum tuberosum]|nr:hypothetical protein KY285_017474 [Solanum tuberosum]